MHQTYRSYGGHRSITLLSDILEDLSLDFGSAIKDIDVTMHFYHSGPAKKTLEQSMDSFNKNLQALPKCKFYRKKQSISLEFQAKFTDGIEIEKSKEPPITIKPDWLKGALEDFIENLSVIKKKLKKADDFDLESFESFLREYLEQIPTSVEELEELEKHIKTKKQKARAQLSEWDKLGIDWDEYFPRAQNLLPEPYLWSCGDEFAPNGNDTGADTFGLFRDWNKKNKSKSPMVFLKQTLKGWEVDFDNPYSDSYTSQTYFQTVVGLAFASVKLRGECVEELNTIAKQSIDKYLEEIDGINDWAHKDECVQKMNKSLEVLSKIPAKAI